MQKDEEAYAEHIVDAKNEVAKATQKENWKGDANAVNDAEIKYKVDDGNEVEKVKIDWHDWDKIGADLRRYIRKSETSTIIQYCQQVK